MKFRIRYKRLGAHVHCRVFQSHTGLTWEKNGDLVFDLEGWEAFYNDALDKRVEVLPEE